MENCIFCKIVRKEISPTIVFEDNDFLAFLDIHPVSDGHLLIIPKKHVEWMQDADDETISKIFILSKKLMIAVKKGIICDYVQLSIAGTDVPHFHIHLIPRYFNDKFSKFPTKTYKERESIEAAKKIVGAL